MARGSQKNPIIVDVDALPPRRHGPGGIDLAPLVAALSDGKPHALEDVRTDDDRRRWRRRLHRAATLAGRRVETRYVTEEARLYFQGHPRTDGAGS